MKTRSSWIVTAVWAAASCAPVWAQEAATPSLKACRPDFIKHCRDMKPGEGRVAECLQQHKTELSAPCQAEMAAVAQCAAEVKKTCATASGKGALTECLKSHEAEFTPQCRSALKTR